ncbi:MAG: DUF86 domain-containing protein [Deltaproteobacteria bacterium]|nr:DUF86 domain-containing protein [Deltaproteobacteria bacterium]
MKDDRLYIIQIKDCIKRIMEYTRQGKDHFMRTPLIQDGVIRNFEIVGEASKQLSAGLKQQFPDVPWKRISGFRDILIHDYMGVDLEEVWGIVENNVPLLQQQVAAILQRCT